MIGNILLSRYKIESELGKGGMGIVYKAHDTLLNRAVAIKFLNTSGVGTEGKARLLQEARAAARLNHPNIVLVYDTGEADGSSYIVMELVKGDTLRKTQTTNLPEVLLMAQQICLALDHAHSNGIIHRDLKLENIIITNTQTLKLMDFGLARAAEDVHLTEEGMITGTMAYLAPELIQGQPASVQSDLYAFGVTLYELLIGHAPFEGTISTVLAQHIHGMVTPPSNHNAEIPAWVDELVFQLLSKRPEERPASAKDVLLLLEQKSAAPLTTTLFSISSKPKNNLPSQLTSFIGREKEIVEIAQAIREHRLVTLTGTGGTGKTRLSLQVAADLLDEYEHGVWFVELASITDPKLVLPTIASTLKVKESAATSIEQTLHDHLHDLQLLLVIDNFEQVVSAAPIFGSLLSAAPKVKVLISSREVLRVRGEHAYPIPPLGLPDSLRKQTAAVLAQYEAIALFIQHAQAANPLFTLDEENASIVAEICTRLDGLPLAIELAAARSRMLTPQAMLEKLSSRIKPLTGVARDLPARQQTIRGAIDWSYDLLQNDEKTFFARLGVFSGGWTLEAAEDVCGEGLSFDTADGLESLLDKSLLRQINTVGSEPRFTMLETIREYSAERLTATSEADAIGERHAEFYVAMVESITNWSAESIHRVIREDDNVRRAVEWSLAHGKPQVVVRFATVLYEIWGIATGWLEKIGWLEQAVTQSETLSGPQHSDALRLIGALYGNAGQSEQGRPYDSEALKIARACGYKLGIARALNNLADCVNQLDNNPASAREMYLEAQGIFRELGEKRFFALVTSNLGVVSQAEHDLDGARTYFTEALKLYTELNVLLQQRWACVSLLQLEIEAGRFEAAREAGVRMLRLAEELGMIGGKIYSILNWGALTAAEGDAQRAARLLGYFEAAIETQDLPPIFGDEQLLYNRALEAIHAKLDEAAFNQAWAEGRALTIEQAIQYALGESND